MVVILINEYHDENGGLWGTVTTVFLTSYPLLFHFSSLTSNVIFRNLRDKTILNVIHYSIFFLENVIIVSFSVWYEPTSTPHIDILAKIVLSLVFGGFAIGWLFCALYYNFFLPSKLEKAKKLNRKSQHIFKAVNNSNENDDNNAETVL